MLRYLCNLKYDVSLVADTAAAVRMVVSTKRRCELRLYVVSKPRRLLSEVVQIFLIFAQRNAKADMCLKCTKKCRVVLCDYLELDEFRLHLY